MSLRWRNELTLRLGASGGRIGCRSAWWLRRGDADTLAFSSADPQGLEGCLARLEAAGRLPARCSVVLDDGLVHYMLLATDIAWRSARDQAAALFSSALPGRDIRVACAPLPGSARWLCAGLEVDLFEHRLQPLAERGIQLGTVTTALMEDLPFALKHPQAAPCQALALVRDHGLLLLGVQDRRVVNLAWERLDTRDLSALRSRAMAFATTLAPDLAPAVAWLPTSASQHELLSSVGWDAGTVILPPNGRAEPNP